MKAVVKVDIVNGKCVVIFSDGSVQEMYEYPSDESGGGSGITLLDFLKRIQPTGDVIFNEGDDLAPTLSYNTKITSFESNSVKSFKADYTFSGCTGLKKIKITSVISSNLLNRFASGCSNLETVSLPKFGGQTTTYSFYSDAKLHTIDLGKTSTIQSYTFARCTVLKKIIIRRPSLCTLQNVSAFSSSPFASDGSGGTLYVPNSLISTYQSDSNWSTILGYANNNIVAIEGSEFENATADGTPIT